MLIVNEFVKVMELKSRLYAQDTSGHRVVMELKPKTVKKNEKNTDSTNRTEWSFITVETSGVLNVIAKLKNSSSVWPDFTLPAFVKRVAQQVAAPIIDLEIFTTCA